jgi:hypothetical protein
MPPAVFVGPATVVLRHDQYLNVPVGAWIATRVVRRGALTEDVRRIPAGYVGEILR